MTALRTAGLIAVMVMLWAVVGWSQEGNSTVKDQRSLPTLELSDVVVVGVEQAGHPQGIRHRELPGVPPAIILSTIVDTREFPRTANGIRQIPGIIPIGTTRFLTAWVGGANHRSADASATIHARGNTAQGALHFDWLSQNGAITWQDRHDLSLRGSGSVMVNRSFLVGFQGLLEQQSVRPYGSIFPNTQIRTEYWEGDILAEWNNSPESRFNVRVGGATWSLREEDFDPETKLNRVNTSIELFGNEKPLKYIVGINGWYVDTEDIWDMYYVGLLKTKAGLKIPLSSRIAAGATLTGAYWNDVDDENEFQLLPDGFVTADLYPLFGVRILGGSDVAILDIAERWQSNPYLNDAVPMWWVNTVMPLTETRSAPWIQQKPTWVRGEINRTIGKRISVRGWAGWERIEGLPVFNKTIYGMFYSDPDTVEISKAGLGFLWQPFDQIEIDVSGERVWGKLIQSAYFKLVNYPYDKEQRSGGVPFLENGSVQVKLTVKPIPAWTFSLSGHLHGERPNWDESSDLPSYGTIGAEIRWKTPTPFWLSLWGENLTDTHYEAFPGYEGEPFRIGIRLGFMTAPY